MMYFDFALNIAIKPNNPASPNRAKTAFIIVNDELSALVLNKGDNDPSEKSIISGIHKIDIPILKPFEAVYITGSFSLIIIPLVQLDL